MAKRAPKQSQLDFLWVNYGEDPKFSKLERIGNQVKGYNDDGLELFSVEYSGPSSGSSNDVVDFGRKDNNYYLKLLDGTEFTAPIEPLDVSELKLIVDANSQALQIINGEGEGSLKEVLRLSKEYTDSKLVDLDVSQLKEQVDKNSSDLLILKGSEEVEGSVINIVNKAINSAFEWINI